MTSLVDFYNDFSRSPKTSAATFPKMTKKTITQLEKSSGIDSSNLCASKTNSFVKYHKMYALITAGALACLPKVSVPNNLLIL